ncbi:hypothetical protein ACLMAJ_02040 [Nocardia sp. KC 131]|uniref:hypothetical protein n=1 Tax=Nocardia arseniciresistens TaxID=3392119 RepID=UPI00398E8B83
MTPSIGRRSLEVFGDLLVTASHRTRTTEMTLADKAETALRAIKRFLRPSEPTPMQNEGRPTRAADKAEQARKLGRSHEH